MAQINLLMFLSNGDLTWDQLEPQFLKRIAYLNQREAINVTYEKACPNGVRSRMEDFFIEENREASLKGKY